MRFYSVADATPLTFDQALKYRPAIVKLCRRYAIELCFLHGSLALHRHGPLSDIDLAIYAPRLTTERLFKFNGDMAALMHRDDVDIALLHRGSSLLGMQVLTKGVPLFVKHPRVLAQFRYDTFRCYLDSQFLRRQFATYVMEAML